MASQVPRTHHARFAREALPRFGLMGKPRALDILATPMGQPLLLDIWEKVGGELPKGEKLSPDGLRASATQIGQARVIVIEMPRPAGPGEAHFVAFVTVPEKRKILVFKEPAVMRCFALEAAAGGTSLLEAQKDGGRQELGAGPAPSVQGFVARLAEVIG